MISYGDLSDAQLLQTYGFVEDMPGATNPHNFALLPWRTLVDAAKLVLGEAAEEEVQGRARAYMCRRCWC